MASPPHVARASSSLSLHHHAQHASGSLSDSAAAQLPLTGSPIPLMPFPPQTRSPSLKAVMLGPLAPNSAFTLTSLPSASAMSPATAASSSASASAAAHKLSHTPGLHPSSSPLRSPRAAPSLSASTSSLSLLTVVGMFRLCIPVIPSQLGWAVGEALLIPYLMSLGLEETSANAIWLVNPFVGFFVQPLVGGCSDGCRSAWGRRTPFLFLFHCGISMGMLLIGFAPEVHGFLFPWRSAFDAERRAESSLLFLIFSGCVVMELCNDLLTIPSRALLNDRLPAEQIGQGNATFSAMNSLGAVIGLTMCLLPLNALWPFSLLESQLRATFAMCIAIIMTSTACTLSIQEWRWLSKRGGEAGGSGSVREQTPDLVSNQEEEEFLLEHSVESGAVSDQRRRLRGSIDADQRGSETEDSRSAIELAALTVVKSNGGPLEHGQAASIPASVPHHEPEVSAAAMLDPADPPLLATLMAFRLFPPPLLGLWITQFAWWLVVMQISFWWTTWNGIEVFAGDPLSRPDVFYEGVAFGITGTLLHALVSLFASQVLPYANTSFGVLPVYHTSAVLYALATGTLWWWRTKPASLWYMILTGLLYPVIDTNPFIVLETYTGYGEEEDEQPEAGDEAEQAQLLTPTLPLTPLTAGGHADGSLSAGAIHSPPHAADAGSLVHPNSAPLSSSSSPATGATNGLHAHASTVPHPHPAAVPAAVLSPQPASPVLTTSRARPSGSSTPRQPRAPDYLQASTHRGVLTGLMNLSMSLSQILSATLGGLVISWLGDITVVFLLSALLSISVNAVAVSYGRGRWWDRGGAWRGWRRAKAARKGNGGIGAAVGVAAAVGVEGKLASSGGREPPPKESGAKKRK